MVGSKVGTGPIFFVVYIHAAEVSTSISDVAKAGKLMNLLFLPQNIHFVAHFGYNSSRQTDFEASIACLATSMYQRG